MNAMTATTRQTSYATPHDAESPTYDPTEPERRLLVAVLQRAMLDIRGGRAAPGSKHYGDLEWYRAAALEWVAAQGEEPWTFAWVCEQAGFDPGNMRSALLASGGVVPEAS